MPFPDVYRCFLNLCALEEDAWACVLFTFAESCYPGNGTKDVHLNTLLNQSILKSPKVGHQKRKKKHAVHLQKLEMNSAVARIWGHLVRKKKMPAHDK